jgi:hypothetical protein
MVKIITRSELASLAHSLIYLDLVTNPAHRSRAACMQLYYMYVHVCLDDLYPLRMRVQSTCTSSLIM